MVWTNVKQITDVVPEKARGGSRPSEGDISLSKKILPVKDVTEEDFRNASIFLS